MVSHFGPHSKFDTVATLGRTPQNGDPSVGPHIGCFGVKLANGWRGIKQALQKRRFINTPLNNENEILHINHDNTVLGAVTLSLDDNAQWQSQVAHDHHAESNLEVKRLQNLVAQLELALADARDRTNADDKGTASARPGAAAVDVPLCPSRAPLSVSTSGTRILSVERLPVISHNISKAKAAGGECPENAPARGGTNHRRRSYYSQGVLSGQNAATRLSQSTSGIGTGVGLARQVITAAAAGGGPSSDSTAGTANVASAVTNSSASLKHFQLSQHKNHHLPDQTAQTYDKSSTDALMAHGASSACPVALLILGVAAGTILPDLPAVRLPAGDDPHPPEPQLTLGGSNANRSVARQSVSRGFGARGPCDPNGAIPAIPGVGGGGGPAVQPPTVTKTQSSGPLCPFACVWVNESAQEQLLLEAADEYDSLLAHMCGRDPTLRALLREMARQMAAEAALPPPLTHLVPGGTCMGLGPRSSSRPQSTAPCTTHPLSLLAAPPLMRSPSIAAANGTVPVTVTVTPQRDQQQLQKGLSDRSPLFADITETPLALPSSTRLASASASSMADEFLIGGSSGGGLHHGFTVLRLTPCRVPAPASALATNPLATSRHTCAAAATVPSFSSAPATRSPSLAMAMSSQLTLVRVSSSPSSANAAPGADFEPRIELPALLIEHVGTDGAAVATVPGLYDRLQRDCSILSGVAAIITLFDLHGRVLHQNALSVDYMGYHRPPPLGRTGAAAAATTDAHRRCHGRASTLERLFEFDPSKLPEMLSDVMDDRPWTGIVRVPAFLWDELDELDEQQQQQLLLRQLPQRHWTERQRRQQRGHQAEGDVEGDTAGVSSSVVEDEIEEQQQEEEEDGDDEVEEEERKGEEYPLPHAVEQLCVGMELGGGVSEITSTSMGAGRPAQIVRGGSSGNGKARLARVQYGNFAFGNPQPLARLMMVGSEAEPYRTAATPAAAAATARGMATSAAEATAEAAAAAEAEAPRSSRSEEVCGLQVDELCSSDIARADSNPAPTSAPAASPLTASISSRRPGRPLPPPLLFDQQTTSAGPAGRWLWAPQPQPQRSRFGSEGEHWRGTQLYGSVADSTSGPDTKVTTAVSHGGDDMPPSEGQQNTLSLSPSVITAAATAAATGDVDVDVLAVSRSAASATAGTLSTRRSQQACGSVSGLRNRVAARISFNGSSFSTLYGSVDRTGGGRRVSGRSPSGNVVLDLQAMNTSAWSLVGSWLNPGSPGRRRASFASGVPLLPPAPPLSQHHYLSRQLKRLSQPLPMTHAGRGLTTPFQSHNHNQRQQEQPMLSEQLLELAELQSVRAASTSANGRRRSTASGSTPLPRVVFFAAASVQRVSAHQQRKPQRQRQPRGPRAPRGEGTTIVPGTFMKSASMPQPGLSPRVPVLCREKDPNQAAQSAGTRHLKKTCSPLSNASSAGVIPPSTTAVTTTSNESACRGHDRGGGGDGGGAGRGSKPAGGSGSDAGAGTDATETAVAAGAGTGALADAPAAVSQRQAALSGSISHEPSRKRVLDSSVLWGPFASEPPPTVTSMTSNASVDEVEAATAGMMEPVVQLREERQQRQQQLQEGNRGQGEEGEEGETEMTGDKKEKVESPIDLVSQGLIVCGGEDDVYPNNYHDTGNNHKHQDRCVRYDSLYKKDHHREGEVEGRLGEGSSEGRCTGELVTAGGSGGDSAFTECVRSSENPLSFVSAASAFADDNRGVGVDCSGIGMGIGIIGGDSLGNSHGGSVLQVPTTSFGLVRGKSVGADGNINSVKEQGRPQSTAMPTRSSCHRWAPASSGAGLEAVAAMPDALLVDMAVKEKETHVDEEAKVGGTGCEIASGQRQVVGDGGGGGSDGQTPEAETDAEVENGEVDDVFVLDGVDLEEGAPGMRGADDQAIEQQDEEEEQHDEEEEGEEEESEGEEEDGEGEEENARWHEISARPFRDPVSRRRCILLMQMDVTAKVETERQLAELVEAEHKILEQIFPRHVLEHMALDGAAAAQRPTCAFHMFRRDVSKLATKHDAVTILFADIKGFTSMCKEVEPEVVMTFLNELYNRFDTLLDVYGVYKVETIGDCYMVAGGLIRKDEEGFASVHGPGAVDPLHAVRVMSFAKAMLREAATMKLPNTGEALKIRVGIHAGPVVSGVVGTRMPRFCLFGDTVNTASRMESTADPGTIHVSADYRQLLNKEVWKPTGGVEVKGKGLMHTYVWLGNDTETAPHLISEGVAPPGGIHGHGSSGGAVSLKAPQRSCTTPRREIRAGVGGTLRVGSLAYRRPKRSITAPRNDHTPSVMQPSRRGGAAGGDGGGGGGGGGGDDDGGGATPPPAKASHGPNPTEFGSSAQHL